MTEPIAVDVPAKPSFSRTTPIPAAAAPLVAALISTTAPSAAPKAETPAPALAPTPNPAPKAETPAPASTPAPAKAEAPSAPKAEAPAPVAPKAEAPAKPAAPAPNAAPIPSAPTPTSPAATAATIAATVAAVAATTTTGVPPEPLAKAVADTAPTTISNLLARFNKKQLTISVAVLSLFAGIGAVKVMFPAKGAAEPSAPVAVIDDDKVLSKGNTPAAATTPPPKVEETSSNEKHSQHGQRSEGSQHSAPLQPIGGPPTDNSNGAIVAPPLPPRIQDPRPTEFPSIPNPGGSSRSNVIPAGGLGALQPPEPIAPPPPASGSTPPVPVPALPSAPNLPSTPASSGSTATPSAPTAPVAPALSPPVGGPTPAASPMAPSPAPTKPDAPAVPLPGSVIPLPGDLVSKGQDTKSAPKLNGNGEGGVTTPPTLPPFTDTNKSTPSALPKPPEPEFPALPGATLPIPGDPKTPAKQPEPATVPPSPSAKSVGAPSIPQPSEALIPPPPGFGTPAGTPTTPMKPQGSVPAPDSLFPGVGPESTKPMGGIAEPPKLPLSPNTNQPGAPEFKPSAPSFDPPSVAIPTVIKPTAGNESRPAAPEFAPKTTFDVDIHTVMPKEDYKSISREFYNEDRFAAALSAYNKNRLIKTGDRVDVPPIHVLKRDFPQLIGGGTVQPASGSRSTAPSQPEWNNAAPRPVANGRSVFTVPNGNGMTLQQIARQTMGSEQRWRDIYDLNPQVSSNERLLPGTELKMPADARLQ